MGSPSGTAMGEEAPLRSPARRVCQRATSVLHNRSTMLTSGYTWSCPVLSGVLLELGSSDASRQRPDKTPVALAEMCFPL